jgi:hypothetical protein
MPGARYHFTIPPPDLDMILYNDCLLYSAGLTWAPVREVRASDTSFYARSTGQISRMPRALSYLRLRPSPSLKRNAQQENT